MKKLYPFFKATHSIWVTSRLLLILLWICTLFFLPRPLEASSIIVGTILLLYVVSMGYIFFKEVKGGDVHIFIRAFTGSMTLLLAVGSIVSIFRLGDYFSGALVIGFLFAVWLFIFGLWEFSLIRGNQLAEN